MLEYYIAATYSGGCGMWNQTTFTEKFLVTFPIVQGPFGGGLSSTRLAAKVSNAGGLGSYGANALPPAQIGAVVEEIRAQTDKPFAVNLWVDDGPQPTATAAELDRALARLQPFYDALGLGRPPVPTHFGQDYRAQVEAALAARPPALSFVFGVPSAAVVDECRARGILTIGTATTVAEARAVEAAGLDAVVATGFEAGGHRPSFLQEAEECLTGTLALVPQVADSVRIPVIAAGGIADARGIVAALALGAQAVQIGTAFLACDESGAPTVHKEAMLATGPRDTALSRVFSGRLARSLRNRFMDEMAPHTAELPPFPIRNWLSGTLRKAAIEQGRSDLISMQAGQGALLIHRRGATELMGDLTRETTRLLARMSSAETAYGRAPVDV
jgi:nitronate monooxygenase